MSAGCRGRLDSLSSVPRTQVKAERIRPAQSHSALHTPQTMHTAQTHTVITQNSLQTVTAFCSNISVFGHVCESMGAESPELQCELLRMGAGNQAGESSARCLSQLSHLAGGTEGGLTGQREGTSLSDNR